MKDLSIEEKAQRYDEAIERARYWEKNPTVWSSDDICQKLFPELKESEDERIRKALKALVTWAKSYAASGITADEAKEMVAWLEKQGKHVNFLSKIQVGDKVTRNEDGVLVNLSQLNRVAKKQGEQETLCDKCKKEQPSHSCQDIAELGRCAVEHEQKPVDKIEPKFKIGNTVAVKPMSCHGKVFKGEPFKIVDIIEDNYVSDDGKAYSISLQDGWELVEQNPAWSKEDEVKLKSACAFIRNTSLNGNESVVDSTIDWLKSLRPQNWTKEDKERYISCLQRLSTGNPEQPETINSKWFKEHVHPLTTWKPSDLQVEALESATENCAYSEYKDCLKELIKQLKKLREK